MKKAFPKAKVTGEFSIYGHEVRTCRAKVEKWLKGLKQGSFQFQEESAIRAKAWAAGFSSLYLLFPEKFMKPPISQIDSWISKYFVPLRGLKRYVRPNLT